VRIDHASLPAACPIRVPSPFLPAQPSSLLE